MKNKNINIIGGGCAALSLARLSDHLPDYSFNIYSGDKSKVNDNHYWGFWKTNVNVDAYHHADYTWSKWAINTNISSHVLSSNKYPYCVIKRYKWLNFCKSKFKTSKIKIFDENIFEKNGDLFLNNKKITGDIILDSRPPDNLSNVLLQHFEGFVVTSKKDVFDKETVILMDFRCDQSKGMHFIYLLPFSKKQALVESTIFSKNIESKKFYSSEISKYLKKYFNLTQFTKSNFEKGVIPMHYISSNSKGRYNIGTRGGAVRPSSGYAFTFIQKQVNQIIEQISKRNTIDTKIHKNIDLFLDKVFIDVLAKFPEIAPKIFTNFASSINGDEMAKFMSGNSSLVTTFKIILNMPKIPFIKSFFSVVTRQ